MIWNILRGLFVVLGASFVSLSSVQAMPAFSNANFEADSWTGIHFGAIPTGWSGATGGALPAGFDNAYTDGPPGTPSDTTHETPFGDQFLAIGSISTNGTDFIEQTVSGFTVGGEYEISFWMSPWLSVASSIDSSHFLDLTIADASSLSSVTRHEAAKGPTGGWTHWELRTQGFIATTSAMTFRFDGASGASCPHPQCDNTGLDNLSLTHL